MAAIVNTPDGGRWYTHNQKRYLAVTKIIELGIPKPALIGWAAKETALYAIQNLHKIDAILRDRDGKFLEGEQREAAEKEAYDLLVNARFRSSTRAAVNGSHVHEAIEAKKLQRPYAGVPKAAEPWYTPFVEMLEEYDPIWLQTEANIFSDSRRYAGTLDTIGIWPKLPEVLEKHGVDLEKVFPKPWGHADGPVLVGDYKTGKGPKKGGVWPETGLQESAYGHGEYFAAPEGDVAIPPLAEAVCRCAACGQRRIEWTPPDNGVSHLDGAVAIHLQPGFCELVPLEIGEEVFNSFLFAYEVARFQLEISKRVVGRPFPPVGGVPLNGNASKQEPEPTKPERKSTRKTTAKKAS